MTAKELMDWAIENKACEEGLAFAMDKTLAEVWTTCERPDWMMWLYDRSKNLEKAVHVKTVIFIAELVLPDFEKKNPDNGRPRKAIEAAKAWLENPTEENRLACGIAAKNAYDAYDAYYAYDAYSAYYAYDAYVAYVAYAAAASAAAASASASTAYVFRFLEVEQQKEVASYIRKLIPSIELE